MKIKAILFDFIGTTVLEKDNAIHASFEKAFQDHQISFDPDILHKNRGKDKKEIIELILGDQYREDLAGKIHHAFKRNVEDSLQKFVLNEGVNEVLSSLNAKNIKIGLGSGLSRDLFEKIFNQLPWKKTSFHYIGIASEVGRGRPHPDMIHDMMRILKVNNPEEFLKVGDTTADIMEGKNAGVKTAAILSGTQSETSLREAHPDFVISKLEELQNIV